MKVGIIALLRQNINVTYFTNKEIWDWCFHKYPDLEGGVTPSLLSIELHPSRPRKAKKDPHISEDVREARRVSKKDTTVIVQGYEELDLEFNDYLFLVNPPSGSILKTDLGTVLTSDDYRNKIFVKGIFVEERGIRDPPPLIYGVDFSKVALDRDRRSLMTGAQVASTLAEIWTDLILKDNGTASAELYLTLLLAKDNSLETLEAKNCITRIAAEKLYKVLRSLYSPDTFFYNAEDTNLTEVYVHRLSGLNLDCSNNSRLFVTDSRTYPAKIVRNLC